MITKLIKKILNNYAYDVFVNRNYDRKDSSIQTISNTKNIDKSQYEQNGILRFRSIFEQANSVSNRLIALNPARKRH